MNYSEKETIVVDGETYFHYSYGGKWNATKFIKIWGIHYYNSDIPFSFDIVQGMETKDETRYDDWKELLLNNQALLDSLGESGGFQSKSIPTNYLWAPDKGEEIKLKSTQLKMLKKVLEMNLDGVSKGEKLSIRRVLKDGGYLEGDKWWLNDLRKIWITKG